MPESLSAFCPSLLQAFPVGALMASIVAEELTINVSQHSCLRSTRKLIGGNDLIADGGQCSGLVFGQEIPIALLSYCAADRNRCASKGANSYESTPREKASFPLQKYWRLQWAGLNSGDSSSTGECESCGERSSSPFSTHRPVRYVT